MKRMFLAAVFTIILVSPVNAQSTLGLQEKCAEGAKKFFFERIKLYGGSWGSFKDEKGHGWNHFTSHYNRNLDKCFIRIEYHYFEEDKNKAAINTIEMWNVFEGVRIGGLSTPVQLPYSDCTVGAKTCNSPSEFENLIRPYMEE